jgi:hypothetical protein
LWNLLLLSVFGRQFPGTAAPNKRKQYHDHDKQKATAASQFQSIPMMMVLGHFALVACVMAPTFD